SRACRARRGGGNRGARGPECGLSEVRVRGRRRTQERRRQRTDPVDFRKGRYCRRSGSLIFRDQSQEHLLSRVAERKVSLADLQRLQEWVKTAPNAPDGEWYKDFGSFFICVSGEYPK